jgi:hypothetical protein
LFNSKLLFCTWGQCDAADCQFDHESLTPTGDERCELVEETVWSPRTASDPIHIDIEIRTVDCIGVGDAWTAGMLYSLLYLDHGEKVGRDLMRWRLQFAHQVVGRKLTQLGFVNLGVRLGDKLRTSEYFSRETN